MKYSAIVSSVVAAVCLGAPAFASSDMWTIDPAHSVATFRIKHLAVGTVVGQFKKLSGTINYDGKNLRDASVEAEISTQSIDSHSSKRDEHLKSKTFFDASEFPRITFKSQKVVPDQTGAFKIKGIISMHGYAREIIFDAKPLTELSGATPASVATATEKRLVTSATSQLDRKDFGISAGFFDKGGALIGDQVQITLDVQLVSAKKPVSTGTALRDSTGASSSVSSTTNSSSSVKPGAGQNASQNFKQNASPDSHRVNPSFDFHRPGRRSLYLIRVASGTTYSVTSAT